MINREEEIKKVISDTLVMQASINDNTHSYTLKHLLERSIDGYISNEECIMWMRDSGYDAVYFDNGPNCYFNVSKASIKNIRKLVGTSV
jgi:hypothetical protein